MSSQNGNSNIKIYQNINIFLNEFDKTFEYKMKKINKFYFVQIEGTSEVNGTILEYGDAMEINR